MERHSTIGIITPDATTLNAILAAVNLAGVQEPPPTPQGELGGCIACGHTVGSHFNNGTWVGCLKGTAGTVFILVPAPSKPASKGKERRGAINGAAASPATAHDTAQTGGSEEATTPRLARRLLYTSAVHHRQNIDNLPLTPTRKKVLKAVHRVGKHGVLARQVMARTKLPHGTVQQTLNWLRNQKTPLVVAEDAAATATE